MVEQRYMAWTHGRWPGQWCIVYKWGQWRQRAQSQPDLQEETSGESTVSPAQGGRVLGRRPREQPSYAQSARQREGWRRGGAELGPEQTCKRGGEAASDRRLRGRRQAVETARGGWFR